jgi:hypothetical protein
MTTNSDYATPHISLIPAPSGKGTFSILSDGALVGRPDSTAVKMWCLTPTGTLSVTYANDAVYFYEDVPMEVGIRLIATDSVGAFINKVVKPNYRFFQV